MSGRSDDPSSLSSLDSSLRTSFSYSVSGLSPPLPSSVRLRLLLASSVVEGEVAPSGGEVEADVAEGRLPRLLLQVDSDSRKYLIVYRYDKIESRVFLRLTSVLRALFSCGCSERKFSRRGGKSAWRGGKREHARARQRHASAYCTNLHLHPAALSRSERVGSAVFGVSATGTESRDSSPGEGFFSFLLFLIWCRDSVLFEPLEEGAVAAKREKWGKTVSEVGTPSLHNAEDEQLYRLIALSREWWKSASTLTL